MNTTQFNKLVDIYSDSLYRFALGIIHDPEGARDITQESYSRLWEHRRSVASDSAKAYLFTITYRIAISDYRTTKRHPHTSIDNYSTAATQTATYDNTTELLWQELDRLPEQSRTLIMLCDWEGYSYQEIAQITNLTEGQVKIGIYRARQTIKQHFADTYHEHTQR